MLGGLFGGGNQKVDNKPWEGVRPYLGGLYHHTSQLPHQEYFPHSTVMPMSQPQNWALNMMQQRAGAGSPTLGAAQNMAQNTLQGDYLYGGQGFDRAFEAASNKIIPGVESRFGAAGRTGSGAAQEAMTRGLGDAFAGLYGDERRRQMQAATLAPGLDAADYTDINAMMNAGDMRRNYAQQVRDDQVNRWNFQQQQPYNRLTTMNNIYTGATPYGQQKTTQAGNPLMGAMGGGLLGLGAMQGLAGMTGGMVPGLAGMGAMGAILPWMGGGALLGGLLA